MVDHIRRSARRLLGQRSRTYAVASRYLDLWACLRRESLGTWRTLNAIEKAACTEAPVQVSLSRLEAPFWLRPGTKDVRVIMNNLVREEFGQVGRRGAGTRAPRWCIDGGAYTGDTAVYYATRWPGCRIIALEPNRGNYEIAQRNCQFYGGRITLVDKALWAQNGVRPFAGTGSSGALAAEGEPVECVSIPSLLSTYGIDRIDILKLDIEGAEESIFAHQPETWLTLTDLLVIEPHGARIEALLEAVLSQNGFTIRRYRSVWYCHSPARRRPEGIETVAAMPRAS